MPLSEQETDRLQLLKLKKRKFELERQPDVDVQERQQTPKELGAGLEAQRLQQNLTERPADFVPPIISTEGVVESIGNIPSSGLKAVESFAELIAHPIQTGEALLNLSAGIVEKLLPEEIAGIKTSQEHAQLVDAVGEAFMNRYGSLENINRTVVEDPVGFGIDLASILSGAGAALKVGGKIAGVSRVVKAGEVLSTAEPLTLVGKGLKRAVGPSKNSLVKTALALPKKTPFKRVDELANAFVKKGLNITRKDLKRLDIDIKNVSNKINKIVDKKTAEGLRIKTDNIVVALDDLIENAGKQGLELPDLKVLERMRKNFIEQNGAILTPRQVQDIKVGFNKGFKADLESRFGQVRSKARDTMRSAAKSQLEELHPELRGLNADEGVMIELKKAIEERVKGLEKAPTIPSTGLVVGGIGGGAVSGATGSAVSGLAFGVSVIAINKIITSPRVQVSLAKALRSARLKGVKTGALAGRVGEIAKEEATPPGLQIEEEQQSPRFKMKLTGSK